jgi:hypothetical protein
MLSFLTPKTIVHPFHDHDYFSDDFKIYLSLEFFKMILKKTGVLKFLTVFYLEQKSSDDGLIT